MSTGVTANSIFDVIVPSRAVEHLIQDPQKTSTTSGFVANLKAAAPLHLPDIGY
jgi:hypothetical protein